jgi:hypothetical protein
VSPEDNFLSLHLIEDVISLDSIRQGHDFVEHESTGGQCLRSTSRNHWLTLTDAASSGEGQRLQEILIGLDTGPSAI